MSSCVRVLQVLLEEASSVLKARRLRVGEAAMALALAPTSFCSKLDGSQVHHAVGDGRAKPQLRCPEYRCHIRLRARGND